MPIFKVNKNSYQTHALYEDPRPQGNRLYCWGEAFNEDDLTYQINDGFNHNQAKTTLAGRGYPSMSYTDHRYDGVLFLVGETVHVNPFGYGTTNDDRNNIDFKHLLSMDPNNPARNHRYFKWGTDELVFNMYNHMWQNNVTNSAFWELFYNSSSVRLDLANISNQNFDNYRQFWMYNIRATTGFIQMLGQGVQSSVRRNWPAGFGPGRITGWWGVGNTNLAFNFATTYDNVYIQRIGDSTQGQGLFLNNSTANDYTHTILRYNDFDNTITTVQTINAIPTTFSSTSTGWLLPGTTSTNGGGARSFAVTTTNVKISSQTFVDLSTVTSRAWYTPYFDQFQTYQPFFFQWNTTTDVFSRSQDIIVDWRGTGTQWAATATQWIYFQPDNVSGSSDTVTYGMQRPWYNETFTVTAGSTTTRYLTLIQMHGSGSAYDTVPQLRTFVTFQVDAVNPKLLVRHSQVIIPWTPKNIIWLSDDKLLLGVFGHNFFNIYTFTQAAGWSLTNSLPFRFDAVGRDQLGRIWAVDPGPFGSYGRLHLISPTVPATITVGLVQPSYNFTGTNILTTATVNAFDTYGNRISSAVTLQIDGTAMRFINTLSQQVTTLTTQTSVTTDTNVSVLIVGSGQGFINGFLTI